MAEQKPEAQPPGGGQQDHSAMRAASMLPVSGPASTDNLAANGGLNVPGGEPDSTVRRAAELDTISPFPELIPGAYEPNTATHREAGAMGGRFNGEDAPAIDASSLMDEAVREEHRREGGGGRHERKAETEDQRARRR